jgi:hypothetical protein
VGILAVEIMTKSLIIESKSTPDQEGYLDTLVIVDGDGVTLLYNGPCSACPDGASLTGIPWDKSAAWIAPTAPDMPLDWKCWISPNHGNKRLLINDGGAVRTRYPNLKHGGNYHAFSIELHKGGKLRRGSMGCITYPPDIADLIDFFEIGETGKLQIVDYSKMGRGAVL